MEGMSMKNIFLPADILLPQTGEMEKWAVIACDQFTSDPAYWQRVRKETEGSVSTVNLIFPEAELGKDDEKKIEQIDASMKEYLDKGVFKTLKNSFVYVERTMEDGSVRKGLVGMIDLEAYSYDVHSESLIRATERTVIERIPPRVNIRKNAMIELPHVILLCDDREKELLEPLTAGKEEFQKLYDFDLMEGGNHIRGWLVSDGQKEAFLQRLEGYMEKLEQKYEDITRHPMAFAVGDGNHSLASAKACYEALKEAHPGEDLSSHPARYALVELENIHDEAQKLEPIHRIITHCNPETLLEDLKKDLCTEEAEDPAFTIKWSSQGQGGELYLRGKNGQLAVGILQNWLDAYLKEHPADIDYIHDDDALMKLAEAEGSIGFLLPPIEKWQLFRGVMADGSLPRKTFSMGHSREKRYYLEGRKIRL